jgi:hypothetical protein
VRLDTFRENINMQDHRQRGSKRPTIGVLVGWQVYDGALSTFLAPLFRGIRAAAKDRGCNLLLACGVTYATGNSHPSYHPAWPILSSESDFVPVGPWNTDGLIVVSPLISEERRSQVRGFLL